MNKKYLIIIIAVFIIILTITICLINKNKFKFKPAFTETNESSNIFNNYKMETIRVAGKNAVEIKNIVARTADNNNSLFKIDLAVVTKDKATAKILIDFHKKTYLVISSVLSNFKTSDVKSIKGKKFLKDTIKRELNKKYKTNNIDAVYFENFIIS